MKFSAICVAVCGVVLVLLPRSSPVYAVLKGLGLLITAGVLCQLYWHGTTLVSVVLRGNRRWLFQVSVAVVTPLVLSAYFFLDVSQLSVGGLFKGWVSWWTLVSVGIIAYVSWELVGLLDKEHPFRGFLLATIVFFVPCFMWHHGMYSEQDLYDDTRTVFMSKENAAFAAETGFYGARFLLYVAVSYMAMFASLRWR